VTYARAHPLPITPNLEGKELDGIWKQVLQQVHKTPEDIYYPGAMMDDLLA
jgi:hypothetical protein